MPDRSYRWQWDYSQIKPGLWRPVLPVMFTFSTRTISLVGLVDSGADWSACSVRAARLAGIDVEALPEQRMSTPAGQFRARRTPIDMEILGKRIATEVYILPVDVILLGRRDVFAAFQFGFDERARLLLIEPY